MLRAISLYVCVWLPISIFTSAYLWSTAQHSGFATDLTINSALWNDSNKLRDLQITPLLLALQAMGIIAVLAITRIFHQTPDKPQLEVLSRLAPILALTLIPLLGSAPVMPIVAAAMLALCFYWRYVDDWQAQLTKGSIVAIATTLIIHNIFELPVSQSMYIGVGLTSLCAAPSKIGLALLHIAYLASAIIICAIFCSMAPRFWIAGQFYSPLTLLDSVFAICIVAALWSVWQNLSAKPTLRPAPPILLGMAFTLFFANEFTRLGISVDDYHFGERLVAFDAILQNRGLFTQLIPAHGLVDTMGGMVAWAGGDTTAGGVVWGERLAYFFSRFATLTLIFTMVRGASGLALGLVLPMPILRMDLAPLFTLLILKIGFIRSAAMSGALAAIVSVISIFFAGGVGAAIAVACVLTLIVARYLRNPSEVVWFIVGALVVSMAVLAAFWPQMLSWANYLLISAQTNVGIYAVAEQKFPLFAYNWPSHGFLFIPSVGGIISVLMIKSNLSIPRTLWRAFISILPLFVIALLLSNYSLTRASPDAVRAIKSTLILAVFLVPWMLLIFPKKPSGIAVAASILILCGAVPDRPPNSPYIFSIDPRTKLMPQFKEVSTSPALRDIGASLRFGDGVMSPEHRKDLSEIKDAIDSLLPAGHSFANFTNRSALSFYLDRPMSNVITSSYNSAPSAFQQLTLPKWEVMPPELALIGAENIEHDGRTLPLRTYGFYRFLVDKYEPFMIDGRIFAAPKGSALIIRSQHTFSPVLLTDKYWKNGIGVGGNKWSFFLEAADANLIKEGDTLLFADRIERRVTRIEARNILVEGAPFNLDNIDSHSFVVKGRPIETSNLDAWRKAFPVRDVGALPAAWGRSISKLEQHIASSLDKEIVLTSMQRVEKLGISNSFQVSSEDPQWIFELAPTINPHEYGLLQLEVQCHDQSTPLVQIFWRTDEQTFQEFRSIKFRATYAKNLVPLDAMPDWLLSAPVSELRIDINNKEQCSKLNLQNVMLRARSDAAGLN